MTNEREEREYDVLGYKVRLALDGPGQTVPPSRVVTYVNDEILAIRTKLPNLDKAQIAVLAALKIAAKKIELEEEYRASVESFEGAAKEAFQMIEEVSPSTI